MSNRFRALGRWLMAAALAGSPLAALAQGQINTGGVNGAYHGRFCPQLQAELARAKLSYQCMPSVGTRENMQRVISNPTEIGFGQLDVILLELALRGAKDDLLIAMQSEDVSQRLRECLFLVTRNRQFTTYGDVASYAGKLRFILPPKKSGSAGTFEFLQQIDRDGLGQATLVTHAASVEEAIQQALAAEDTFTLFVQFPDPSTEVFKLIDRLGGQMIPVIDRRVLSEQVFGAKIYFAQETEIAQPKWSKSGRNVVTACTPLVLFTGVLDQQATAGQKREHDDLIKTVRDLKAEALLPKQGPFVAMMRRTKQVSGTTVERMQAMSDQARKSSAPYLERLKELMGRTKPGPEAPKPQ